VGESEPVSSELPPQEALRICAVLRRALERVCPADLLPDREDLVHAALVKLLELRGRAEQNGSPPASYLWQVAFTTVADELRRRGRRRAMEERSTSERSEPEVPEPRPDLRASISACLETLSADRRASVTLHLHGYSANEAARVLGWATKRVQNLCYRGLADLRRCLRAKGAEP
jgi:RNA polymerase sigma-70 factor (ECF subfamily)